MPLLDHFRTPILNQGTWEGFHGMWPAMMVMLPIQLRGILHSAAPSFNP